jgi:hypothetical protein
MHTAFSYLTQDPDSRFWFCQVSWYDSRFKSGKEDLARWRLTALLHFVALPRFVNALTLRVGLFNCCAGFVCSIISRDARCALPKGSFYGWMHLAAEA